MLTSAPLRTLDPDIYAAIAAELARQQGHIELIASENFTYPAVMEAQGSVLTNKYAEGHRGEEGRAYGDHSLSLSVRDAQRLLRLAAPSGIDACA